MQMSNDYPPCVLLARGRTYASTLGVIRSLGSRGVAVYVLTDNPETSILSAASRYCYKVITINLEGNSIKICEYIASWCRDQSFSCRPLLLPLTDKPCTYIAEGRAILEEVFLVGLDKSNVTLDMLDKSKADKLARHNGLDIPLTGTAASLQELIDIVQKVHYPVIVKPTMWRSRGETQFKTMKFEREDQLRTKGYELINGGAILLIQEFIPGDDNTIEFFLFYRSQDGNNIIGCTGLKMRQLPPGAGILASGKTVWLPHVAKMSKNFLERIDFRGLGGIEYKRYNGKSYFIEMSVRPEGFHSIAIKAGIDFTWYAYSDIVLNKKAFDQPKQKMSYYLSEYAYLTLLGKYFNKVPVIREVLVILTKPSVCFAVWTINDPMPMVMMVWQIIHMIRISLSSLIINGMTKLTRRKFKKKDLSETK